ncbi:hypothetical protein OSB04_025683 [Centaurea solstitialis]|uniref:Uncharacterized protein n=1 Tax=Centaurea solstitialis TaxID=347529 RepID=A0AA38WF04_9ASTR|nr:hypothetical protein OSB04_025683 [Centaurea solstitialis]
MANKRKRRYVGLVDEEDGGGEDDAQARKWPVRKLSDEFERLAGVKNSPTSSSDEMGTVASRTHGRKMVAEEVVKTAAKGGKWWVSLTKIPLT